MDSINLPRKWDLYKYTQLPYFNDWEEGAQANAIYESQKSSLGNSINVYKRISKIGGVLGPILILVMLASQNSEFWNFLFMSGIILTIVAYLLRENGLFRTTLYNNLNKAFSDWQTVLYRHTDIFIRPLADKFMEGRWNSYRTGRKCLIYNNKRFIYFDAHDRTLVVFNNSNIKEVTKERLLVSSSSSGVASTVGAAYTFDNGISVGGAGTSTHSNTINNYEWHFDILTDFLTYPKVSLILNDSQAVEDFVGKAYAILKP